MSSGNRCGEHESPIGRRIALGLSGESSLEKLIPRRIAKDTHSKDTHSKDTHSKDPLVIQDMLEISCTLLLCWP